MAEAYYPNVSLLFPFDLDLLGIRGFVDYSPLHLPFTYTGNPVLQSGIVKHGDRSLQLSGAENIVVSHAAGFAFGTGDYTVEAWVYFTANSGANNAICSLGPTGWELYRRSATQGMAVYNGSTNVIIGSTALTNGVWHHVAVTRSGTNLKLFVDGVLDGSATNSDNITTTSAYIGTYSTGSEPLSGYLDDVRITKGVARYTANFTPPSSLKEGIDYTLPSIKPRLIELRKKQLHRYNLQVWGGDGAISGTVKIGAVPAKRRVRLYDAVTGLFVTERWSAEDGSYQFTQLRRDLFYTVTSTDDTGTYNDVVAARVTPV
jgi:hypothetical protein